MKNVLMVIGLSLLAFACGKDSSSNNSSGAVAAQPYGNCAVGQVYTQYGCLPQGTCPVGQGLYGSTCVPAITSNTGLSCQGACPVGQVYTQYGCQIQNTSCGACGALVNGTCVQGLQSGYTNGYFNGGYAYGGNMNYYYPYNGYGYGYNRCVNKGWYWYCY